MIGPKALSTLHPFVNEMSPGHATPHFPRLGHPIRLQECSDLPFHHAFGPDKGVYIMQIGEERELFFNLLYWLE